MMQGNTKKKRVYVYVCVCVCVCDNDANVIFSESKQLAQTRKPCQK